MPIEARTNPLVSGRLYEDKFLPFFPKGFTFSKYCQEKVGG
jgi:hypothetical protein